MTKISLYSLLVWAQLVIAGYAQSESGLTHAVIPSQKQILATFNLSPAPAMRRSGRSGGFYSAGKQYRQSVFDDQKAEQLAKRYKLKKVAEWPIHVLEVHCVVYELITDEPLATVISRISEDADVESVQPMNVFKVNSKAYNDPYFKLQHNLKSLQIPTVHGVSTGRGIKLAVIDSGVDINHPDLKNKVEASRNFVDQQEGIFNTDIHGTAVAGVIASAVNNGVGIIGIAPEVKLWALKACWQTKPSVSEAICNSFTLTQAISFAIEQGVNILNLSLSGPEDSLLKRIIQAALKRNMIVVTAYDQHNQFPASINNVIAVAENSFDKTNLSAQSNRGLGFLLHAPGTDILTTLPNGHYDYISGSSFAAAHISGIVALLLEHKNNLTAEQIYRLLSDPDQTIINVCSAMEQLLKKHTCSLGVGSASY